MRRYWMGALPLLCACGLSLADEYSNPYNGRAASGAGIPPLPGAAIDLDKNDAVSKMFSENRTLLDTLEVVGRGTSFAVLRYPMTSTGGASAGPAGGGVAGAGAAGTSYRNLTVRDGRDAYFGGRHFKVELPRGETTVLLIDPRKGDVLWEGDLTPPKSYPVSPDMKNYQFTPPESAGVGIDDGKALAASSAAPAGGAPGGAPPGGAPAPGGAVP